MRLLTILGCAPAMFAAQIIGTNNLAATFSSTNQGVTFTAVSPDFSTNTTQGTVSGPITVTTLSAAGTNFTAGALSVSTQMNLTAGPGSSFSIAMAEAYSGAVRVTNNTASQATFVYGDLWTLSVQSVLPTNASISYTSQLQFFNTASSQWETRFSAVNTISNGGSATFCQAGCSNATNLAIGANTSVDYRLYARLRGSASQVADPPASVPEPSSFALIGSAGLAYVLRRRFRA